MKKRENAMMTTFIKHPPPKTFTLSKKKENDLSDFTQCSDVILKNVTRAFHSIHASSDYFKPKPSKR